VEVFASNYHIFICVFQFSLVLNQKLRTRSFLQVFQMVCRDRVVTLSGLRRGDVVAKNEIMAQMNENPEKTPQSNSSDYSYRIRLERQKRAWTQEFLAEKCGLSPRTIQRLECGESPSPETLRLLAAAFGIAPEELRQKPPRTIFTAPDNKRHDVRNLIILLIAMTLADIIFLLAYDGFPPTVKPSFANAVATGLTLVCIIYWLAVPWIVRSYVVRNGKLLVNHPGWAHHYDLTKLTGISPCPQAGMGAARVFSFTNFSSLSYSRQMGYFRSFVMDTDRAVLLEFGKKKIVVSPDDPQAFIDSIRAAVCAISAEREIPVPACLADFSGSGGDHAEKIRSEREQRGWTQEELAEKSGLSTRTLQRLEKGAPPSAETLRRLAETFGISISEMETTPQRHHFKSPLPKDGRLRKTLLILLGIYCICVFCGWLLPVSCERALAIIINIIFWLIVINAFFVVTGYSVKDGKLFVNLGLGHGSSYDLRKLTGLEINPQALLGALPLTWPIDVPSPWCKSPTLGFFRTFVTDPTHCVVLEFGRKKIVVTPDDPQAFVQAVREELKALD
jgi:transcriptional regulator with XRE-family HTH domain